MVARGFALSPRLKLWPCSSLVLALFLASSLALLRPRYSLVYALFVLFNAFWRLLHVYKHTHFPLDGTSCRNLVITTISFNNGAASSRPGLHPEL
jgi:hypothetical protein